MSAVPSELVVVRSMTGAVGQRRVEGQVPVAHVHQGGRREHCLGKTPPRDFGRVAFADSDCLLADQDMRNHASAELRK